MTNAVNTEAQEIDAHALHAIAQYKNFSDLAGKVVFITGAGSGIGRAMADAFAVNGAHLALLDINADLLAQVQRELHATFPQIDVMTFVASITDDVAVAQAVDAAQQHFGCIDVLLNNAGISANRPTLELAPADWRRAIDINLNGVFYCAQAAGRHMVQQGSGVILNTASMYGTVAAPERAAYCASKAAVVMLTKVMAVEWAPAGLRVNALAPGYVQTALVDELVRTGRMDLDALVKRTPARRLGQPHEIATLALFLASGSAAYINGQAIVADGGWSAYSYI
ncbi:SDR family NAD(P)-dependent oxidoreductase [Herbaspirillum autotrophicum]|uniref:SDR family NAD(P)-dependent oxidoreductase n=1 Tax=Herbaspirillum autotrophicum TaxID=180195 RepID=UPI0009F9AE77|nr:glucose 1-dehydrogenase [Herbaspirillum autotrophicum]